ncbi:hypothetical protein EIK77_010594 [Talaromyces pinophilus]|nr:hypothetical protein EIK77_010594 [Talaromyces pinophilus]
MTAPAFIADDHTLAAIMCLGMSEMYSQPSGHEHGWFSHNGGGCELIKRRGSSILETELGRSLFIRFHVTGIWRDLTLGASKAFQGWSDVVHAMHSSPGTKWSFALADPGMSRLSESVSQNYYDLLIEKVTSIPSLLQAVGSLSTQSMSQSRKAIRAKALIERAVAIVKSLFSWFATTDCLQVYQADTSTVMFPCDNTNILPPPVAFPNLMIAQALVHYWAAMIVVLRCIIICHEKLSFSSEAPRSTKAWLFSQLGVEMEPETIAEQFADAICSSVDYCSATDKGTVGAIILLHPLAISKDFYANSAAADASAKSKRDFCILVLNKFKARGLLFAQALIQLSGHCD